MDFGFTAEEEEFRAEVRKYITGDLLPPGYWRGMEGEFDPDRFEFTKQVAKKLGAKKWLAIDWPREYGGLDAPPIQHMIFKEEATYLMVPGLDMGIGGITWVGPTLLLLGTEEQKRRHLLPLAAGEEWWCTLYSEPDAGSDMVNIQCGAALQGDEYIVNGQKIWTSGAHRADWGFMLARTNPEEKRSKGLSFFLVDMKTPGITVRPLYSMAKGHMFNEVFLDYVHVPVRNRVGEENQGWFTSQMTSNFERSMIDLFSNARRDLEKLVEFCRETAWSGRPLSENQIVRHKLAQLSIEIEAGLAYSHSVVWNQIKGGLISAAPLAAAAKVMASELTQRLNYAGCDIMGLYGQVGGTKWGPMGGRYQNYYQQCMGLNMGGGTSEVMRNLVSSMGLGLPRSW
jgi:alkylation response protein AidB-like acyl-CoA dehydrogenase